MQKLQFVLNNETTQQNTEHLMHNTHLTRIVCRLVSPILRLLFCVILTFVPTPSAAKDEPPKQPVATPKAAEPKAAEPNPPVVTAEDPKPETKPEPETKPANEPPKKPRPEPVVPIPLFNGKTLDGWRGYSSPATHGWSVSNGELAFSGQGDDIITNKQFKDFELELEFKTAAETNSGVLYRVRLGDNKPYMSGPEYQILSTADAERQKVVLRGTGSLHALYPTHLGLDKPVGEWNTAKIVVKGERFEHWLNGTKVVDVDTSSEEFKTKLKTSSFNGWPQFNQTKTGHIALQAHGHPVWFRKITVRETAK